MRYQKYHLLETDFSKINLENILNSNQDQTLEMNNQRLYIQNASWEMDGKSWSTNSKPLSEYARNNLMYLQSFTYFEMKRYFTRRRNLDSCLLKYTYEGEGELFYEGNTYTVGPGQGFIIDCRKPHEYRLLKAPWNHVEVHIGGKPTHYLLEQMRDSHIVTFEEPEMDFQPELNALLDLHETVALHRELRISHQLEQILLLILCHSDSAIQTQHVPENLKYLMIYIDRHYMQPLTLDFMAEFSGISKYHLCRLFKKYLGYTPAEYIIQMRLEHAKNLMTNTDIPTNKIAMMVGFSDANYFYRLFRNKIGITAGKFRHNLL